MPTMSGSCLILGEYFSFEKETRNKDDYSSQDDISCFVNT